MYPSANICSNWPNNITQSNSVTAALCNATLSTNRCGKNQTLTIFLLTFLTRVLGESATNKYLYPAITQSNKHKTVNWINTFAVVYHCFLQRGKAWRITNEHSTELLAVDKLNNEQWGGFSAKSEDTTQR